MLISDGSVISDMVPTDMQEELKTQYSALLELLRHFWACFPVQSKSLEEKVSDMVLVQEIITFTE